jgi:virginiamycin B lyase
MFNLSSRRFTLAGHIREFPLPSTLAHPHSITLGPDQKLWFTELQGSQIGRISAGE